MTLKKTSQSSMLQIQAQSLKGVNANPTLRTLRKFCYDFLGHSVPFLAIFVPGIVIAPSPDRLRMFEWSGFTSTCPACVAFHLFATADVDLGELVGSC